MDNRIVCLIIAAAVLIPYALDVIVYLVSGKTPYDFCVSPSQPPND